jgi:hypothetical protein
MGISDGEHGGGVVRGGLKLHYSYDRLIIPNDKGFIAIQMFFLAPSIVRPILSVLWTVPTHRDG